MLDNYKWMASTNYSPKVQIDQREERLRNIQMSCVKEADTCFKFMG